MFIEEYSSLLTKIVTPQMLSQKEKIMMQALQKTNQPNLMFNSQQNQQSTTLQQNQGVFQLGQQNQPITTSFGTTGFGANNLTSKTGFIFGGGQQPNTSGGFGFFNNNTNNQPQQQLGIQPIINFDSIPDGQTTKPYQKPEKLITSVNQHLFYIQNSVGIHDIQQTEVKQTMPKFRTKGAGSFAQNIEKLEMLSCGQDISKINIMQ